MGATEPRDIYIPHSSAELSRMTEDDLRTRMSVLCLMLKCGSFDHSRHLPEMAEIDRRLAAKQFKKQVVYVIGTPTMVKIGTTGDLTARLRTLQAHSPRKLRVVRVFAADEKVERRLHRQFADYRVHGEWFCREGELDAWIKEGCPL